MQNMVMAGCRKPGTSNLDQGVAKPYTLTKLFAANTLHTRAQTRKRVLTMHMEMSKLRMHKFNA